MCLVIYRKENQDLIFRFVRHYPFTRQVGEINSLGWTYLGCQTLGPDYRFHDGQCTQVGKELSKFSRILKILRS